MTPEQAAQAVASARQQAQATARRDFLRLQAQALQAGQTRAERLFPISPRPAPQRAVVNARGSRILRGWYAEVYTAALRNRLGERVRVPAAAEVDATATALRRTLGSREPDLPLRLAGSVYRTALDDAAATGTSLHAALTGAAQRRSAAHVAHQAPTARPAQRSWSTGTNAATSPPSTPSSASCSRYRPSRRPKPAKSQPASSTAKPAS